MKSENDSSPGAERTGAQCLIEGLERTGVEVVFGYPGGMIIDVFNVLTSSRIHFILVRHEQGAAHMADGYARATGKVGCCIVTSGPGATNTVTGLATAYADGIPMVCISGQVATSMIGNDAFQEADITGITRPITKHNYLVHNVDELPGIIAEAFYIASTGKPGPVLIDLPKDIQRQTTREPSRDPATTIMRSYQPVQPLDEAGVAALAKAINLARRPLLYAGGGVNGANAAEVLAMVAHRAGIPVTTTLMGLGAFPEDDPLSLRMLGMHGSVAANKAVAQCDLLIAVGARFDDRVTGKTSEFAPLAKKAHIDIDRSAISKSVPADISIHGDVREVLEALLPRIAEQTRNEWVRACGEWKAEFPFTYASDTAAIPPQYVIEQVGKISDGRALIVTDVGQHQMWSAQFIVHKRPRHFLTSGGLGTMGFGLPAAIGAQFGCPGKLVVCITGDGGIQMNFQELVVAVEHRIPLKIVIINNGHLGMVRQWQQMFYGANYSAVTLTQHGRPGNEGMGGRPEGYLPDFVKIAEAHGAHAVRITDIKDVTPTLREAFESPLVWVMEFCVSAEENVFPMVPPGGTIEQIIHRLA